MRTSGATSSASIAFQAALDLFEVGIDLMRQNLRRSYPDADEQRVESLLHAWLVSRPGAEHGDSAGRPVDVETRLA